MKKSILTAIAVALSGIVMSTSTAVASGNTTENKFEQESNIVQTVDANFQLSEQEYSSLIEYSIQKHLIAQNIFTESTVEYSNPIPYYNLGNQEIAGSQILIFSAGEIIGKMSVYYEDGIFSSDFDTSVNAATMNFAVLGNSNVALGGQNNSEFFYSDGEGWSYLDGVDTNTLPTYLPSITNTVTIAGSCNIPYIMPYSLATHNLAVKWVSNSTTYSSSGQCWASCVAMVVNYGKNKALTSNKVYEDLTNAGLNFSYNGTAIALDYYSYTYLCTDSSMTSGDVATALKNKRPVIMHITNSSGNKHAVVIKGIILDTSSSTYTILDPNKSTPVTKVMVGNPVASQSNISLTSAGVSFTTWYDSFY